MADNMQALVVPIVSVLLPAVLSYIGVTRAKHYDGEERARGSRKMLLRELRMRLATGIANELGSEELTNLAAGVDHDAYVGKIAQRMNDYLYGHDRIVVDFVATDFRYRWYLRSVFVLECGVLVLLVISIVLAALPFVYPGRWGDDVMFRWLMSPTVLVIALILNAEVQRARFNRLVDRYEVVLGEKS